MERIVTYHWEACQSGTTVERFLRRQGVSHRVLIDLKNTSNGISINGAPVRTIDRLPAHGTLRICLPETDCSDTIPQADIPLQILYEDDDLFVLNKPAGIAVHPSPQNRENTIANGLAALYAKREQPFVFRAIGRLDKNTSGLIVLAKNALSAGLLTAQASQKILYHTYLAVCTGQLPESGTIHAPIGRAEDSVIRRIVRADGDRAITHYARLDTANGYSLARVWLETGRTHQIRVHFSHIGHPLPGDFLYHPDFSKIDRHALHAHTLTLWQPITGQPLFFTAPLPPDMQVFGFSDTAEYSGRRMPEIAHP